MDHAAPDDVPSLRHVKLTMTSVFLSYSDHLHTQCGLPIDDVKRTLVHKLKGNCANSGRRITNRKSAKLGKHGPCGVRGWNPRIGANGSALVPPCCFEGRPHTNWDYAHHRCLAAESECPQWSRWPTGRFALLFTQNRTDGKRPRSSNWANVRYSNFAPETCLSGFHPE